ncbi:MAG TPA: homoserine kinase [Polyangiaceae bacterium]
MALLTPLSLERARELLEDYGLALTELEPLAAGSVNSNFRLLIDGGARYFARIYEEQDQAGAVAELEMVQELERAGVPVVKAVPRLDGKLVHEIDGKPFAVYPWLEGEILCQARVDARAARAIGTALARVHQCGARFPALGAGRFGPGELAARLDLVEARGDADLRAGARFVRAKYAEYLPQRSADLPKGLIHSDLFKDNVLWRDGQILALIDFESASTGPYLYDLMVTLLAWCYSDHLDQELAAALLQGYAGERPLGEAELAAVGVEAALACLRFATTRMTDFSLRTAPGCPPGRDYRRFLSRLAEVEAGALAKPLRTLHGRGLGAIT